MFSYQKVSGQTVWIIVLCEFLTGKAATNLVNPMKLNFASQKKRKKNFEMIILKKIAFSKGAQQKKTLFKVYFGGLHILGIDRVSQE